MNMVLSLLINHLLSVIEHALIEYEPEMIASLEQEIELLINKLESYVANKEPKIAPVLNPVLNSVDALSKIALDSGAQAVVQHLQTPS